MQYKRTVVINYTKERCYLGVNVIWSVGLRNSEGEKRTEVSCLIVMAEPNISLHAKLYRGYYGTDSVIHHTKANRY